MSGREGLKRETWADTVFDSPFSGLIHLVLLVPFNPIHTYNFLNRRLGSLLEELLMPWTDRQRDSMVGLKSQFRLQHQRQHGTVSEENHTPHGKYSLYLGLLRKV